MIEKTRWYTNHFCSWQTKQGCVPNNIVHDRQNSAIYQPMFSMADKTWRYTNQSCPRQTKLGEIPTNFVHDRQNRLIYQPILPTTDTTVNISPILSKIMSDIPTILVQDRQNRLLYQTLLSTTEKKRTIPIIIVHERQNHVIYQHWLPTTDNQNLLIYKPLLSTADKTGRYNNQYCPWQTYLGDKPTIIVHDRQNRLIDQPILFTKRNCEIYQPISSMTDKSGYTNHYCQRRTKSVHGPTIIV